MLQFQLCSCGDVDSWARENFAGCRLRDPRRARRAQSIARGLARSAGLSLPALFDSPCDVKAAYAFFDRPEATPDAVQSGHRDAARDALREEGAPFVLAEDTSDLTWSGNQPVEGLGPVGPGTKGLQGFQAHSVLAVRWPAWPEGEARPEGRRPPVRVLGLADQIFHVRTPRPKGEGRGNSKARQSRVRESHLWLRASERLGAAPEGVRWERVCDRGADIYEFLRGCLAMGHGFTVRACQDRALAGARPEAHAPTACWPPRAACARWERSTCPFAPGRVSPLAWRIWPSRPAPSCCARPSVRDTPWGPFPAWPARSCASSNRIPPKGSSPWSGSSCTTSPWPASRPCAKRRWPWAAWEAT